MQCNKTSYYHNLNILLATNTQIYLPLKQRKTTQVDLQKDVIFIQKTIWPYAKGQGKEIQVAAKK